MTMMMMMMLKLIHEYYILDFGIHVPKRIHEVINRFRSKPLINHLISSIFVI